MTDNLDNLTQEEIKNEFKDTLNKVITQKGVYTVLDALGELANNYSNFTAYTSSVYQEDSKRGVAGAERNLQRSEAQSVFWKAVSQMADQVRDDLKSIEEEHS